MSRTFGVIWGVWDLFHIGHLNILKKASKGCDILVIGVFSDEVVKSYKGAYPIINQEDRLEIIRNLNLNIPIVFLAKERKPMNNKDTFPKEAPIDIVFVSEKLAGKKLAMVNPKTFKGRIHYLPYTKGISTKEIINYCKVKP